MCVGLQTPQVYSTEHEAVMRSSQYLQRHRHKACGNVTCTHASSNMAIANLVRTSHSDALNHLTNCSPYHTCKSQVRAST
mmetsp:Transcript_28298/g.45848  ORF Transcript_28298/g.45848 Transcript_28298/m.45848 type:complete len:80 (+) Transcript_28298:313-552(+)